MKGKHPLVGWCESLLAPPDSGCFPLTSVWRLDGSTKFTMMILRLIEWHAVTMYCTYQQQCIWHHSLSHVGLNTWAPGRCGSDCKGVISQHMLRIEFMSASCEISLWWMPQNTFDNKSTWVSGNGLVPSENNPLPEIMLTRFYAAIWRHLWKT